MQTITSLFSKVFFKLFLCLNESLCNKCMDMNNKNNVVLYFINDAHLIKSRLLFSSSFSSVFSPSCRTAKCLHAVRKHSELFTF